MPLIESSQDTAPPGHVRPWRSAICRSHARMPAIGRHSRKKKDGAMKVLLVYPEFPDTFWSFKHALCFENKKSAFPPLGLLTVAAMLPPAWERRLLDTNVQHLRKPEIAWADIIFVSGMLIQRASMQNI